MRTRKIYVRRGEVVEIRVVPDGFDLSSGGWNESSLRPPGYLAKFFDDGIDIPVPQIFTFRKNGITYVPAPRITGAERPEHGMVGK